MSLALALAALAALAPPPRPAGQTCSRRAALALLIATPAFAGVDSRARVGAGANDLPELEVVPSQLVKPGKIDGQHTPEPCRAAPAPRGFALRPPAAAPQ